MIKKIIKCLKNNNEVSAYLVREIKSSSKEAFYVLKHLETTRMTNTIDYHVTVYHEFVLENEKYLGSSSFIVNHRISEKELIMMINDAVEAAKLVKNKYYELPQGIQKKSFKDKPFAEDAFDLIDKIATIFNSKTDTNTSFNAIEIFYRETTEHLFNSNGVDLKKTTNKVEVEAIPSYNGPESKVELYKMYDYQTIDFKKINEDAEKAIADVTARYNAVPLENLTNIDVILEDKEIGEFFGELISNYSYPAVYRHTTDKVIGDMIQSDVKGELVNIALKPISKANAFDNDGILLKEIDVISNGKIVNYYGGNQYAYYLNIKPSGNLGKIKALCGKTTTKSIMSKPHLAIKALSGIQMDIYSGYIGGEVRLAIYFDGKNYIPVSGFSFSGNISNCLSDLQLSSEKYDSEYYEGPKYLKLKNMEVL